MGVKFTICEDEKEVAKQLSEYVQRVVESMNESAEITIFTDGEQLLAHYPNDTDILLLDIVMGQMDGMEVARRLRDLKRDVCIIFVTSMAQYAIEGYKVRAFSFLTKPIQYEEFRLEISMAIDKVLKMRGKELVLKSNQKYYRINSQEIYYIEVQNHKISIHLKHDTIEFTGKLSDLEEELKTCGFARCHAAFLVGFRYIRIIGNDCLILDGEQVIPISRNRRKSFLQAMTEYVGGDI